MAREAQYRDFVSGGYRILKRCQAGEEAPPSPLLPPAYFSLSSCLGRAFPDSCLYGYAGRDYQPGDPPERMDSYADRAGAAQKFGLKPADIPDVHNWASEAVGVEFGSPDIFYQLRYALRATEWVNLPTDDYGVIGCGLHRALADPFIREAEAGQAGMGASECLQRGDALAGGGTVLGFELVNLELGQLCHSWLCGGLQDDFAKEHNIRPNRHGLLSTFEEATFCASEINQGRVGAEPGPWFPWMLIQYR